MTNVSDFVLNKGKSFYSKGKFMMKWLLLGGLALMVLIMLISQIGWGYWGQDYLIISGTYGFVNFLMVIAYLGILIGLIGIPFYFIGLHYMGLGQIAKNTDNFNSEKSVSEELPEL